jgi:hypothetical protein
MVATAQDLNRHPDEGELEEYLMAGLREKEAAQFQDHLLNFGQCQQRLAETDAYVASMRRAAAVIRHRPRLNPDSVERPRWNWPLLIPVLAAVVLLIAAASKSGSSVESR